MAKGKTVAGKKAQPKASEPTGSNQMRRLVPPLAFLVALCLMVVCFYDSGYTSLPPTGKRYDLAKANIETLRQDEKRSGQREPWENLAAEFRAIYNADPGWPNRPAALFRAAESLEELARRSFAKADARKAIECYEAVAQRHADSRLADDALFRAAKLHAAWLKDDKGALALLERIKAQYPKGDMIQEALALEKTLQAAANGRTAPEARQVSSTDGKEPKDEAAPAKGASAPTPNTAASSTAGGADAAGGQIAKASALQPLPQAELLPRYREAKTKMDALRADKVRSCWRQPWEELTAEFLRIYTSRKDWAISPGALFRAAASQEALSDCSHLADEYRQARDLYLKLAQEFPKSALADDSLLRAASIEADRLNQTSEALELLDAILALYSGGDMVAEAQTLRTRLTGAPAATASKAGNAPQVTRPVVQSLSWNSLSKNSVEIVLELSAPARYTAKLNTSSAKGKNRAEQASLHVALENASVEKDIRKGVNIRGSLFKGMSVSDSKGGETVLQFNFQDARRFDARTETNPCRIILRVAGGSTQLPPVSNAKAGFADAQPAVENSATVADASGTQPATPPSPRLVRDMARQLGLTVRTVFIDAGHGGRDPGTNHNGVLERIVSLDVALTLGRLLEANGLEVVYSRTADKHISLRERTTMANAAGADLFVSIHINANDDPSVQGFETYYLDIASNPEAARLATLENADGDHRLGDMQKMLADVMLNARVDESRHLAQDIQRLSQFRLKRRQYDTKDNGIKSAPFIVLLGAQMPAVLVEIGYCTNREEAARLLTPKYRMTLAEGLAEGILAYKDKLLKRRTVQNSLTQEGAGAM
ncbi:N-acetylmuramoyl-L-alanine amidase [Desulfovibrio desulfuricans]|nr:N-acetylmuramoyl-L-alanine amidase [Desulfovibrio desulfuricans]UIB01233.1 N-acetylmuramoyl-L-alanine amidase [Desulfovibrio desulfuricans]